MRLTEKVVWHCIAAKGGRQYDIFVNMFDVFQWDIAGGVMK